MSTAQDAPPTAAAPRAGRRRNWGDLPDDARAAVCEHTGPIDRAGSADLPLVVEAMTALGRIPCPDPDVELGDAGQRWSAYLDDPADAELFTGAALLHTDWNPTNVLITGAGAAHLVDWPWATRGAAWIDPACWVVWLVFVGHTLSTRPSSGPPRCRPGLSHPRAPSTSSPPPRPASGRPPQTPTFHVWTQRLRDAAAQWATYRTGT